MSEESKKERKQQVKESHEKSMEKLTKRRRSKLSAQSHQADLVERKHAVSGRRV